MSEQIICDDCGEVIDPTKDHYRLTGSKVKLDENNVLTTVDPPQTLHYHPEHLPVYKVGGEPIAPETPEATPTPETPPETEAPTEVQP